MGEWIGVAEALKIHHITKPTLYKYIGLGKVFTKVEKNRLFIDRQGLKEYINNKKKYGGKAVNTYIKGLFDDNNDKPEKEPEKQILEEENNSQSRLATVALGGLGKMSSDTIEHYRLIIKERDISLEKKDLLLEDKNNIIEDKNNIIENKNNIIENKNKTIIRLTGFMWLIIGLFISLSIAFIYFVTL